MNPPPAPPPDEWRRDVRRFLAEASPAHDVRRLMESADGYDPVVWRRMADVHGMQGLLVPRQWGGSGGRWGELAVVMEEMGRVLLCAPFLSTGVLATTAIMDSGDEDAQRRLLPPIAAGRLVATVAVADDEGGWETDRITATAAGAHGATSVLEGRKEFVLDGHVAEIVVVAARTAGGVSLFVVEGDARGLTRTVSPTMDQTRRLAALEFSATPARLLGRDGSGGKVLRRILDLGAVALATEQVGGAQRCLEMAVDHATSRYQFGRPIGSFQAVKHRCADMLMAIETARSAAGHAARTAASPGSDRTLGVAASVAKVSCSEAFFRVAAATVQVHGATGFSWHHDAHLYFKRAASSQLLFGDPAHHRRLLAGHLGI